MDCSLKHRVQRAVFPTPHVDLLRLLPASFDDFKEDDKCTALVVRQVDGLCIRHPAMDTTSTRVHPEEMFEPKSG